MSLREDRLRGFIRLPQHRPTNAMLADGLTKSGTFLQLLHYVTTGLMTLNLRAEHYVRTRARTQQHRQITEDELRDNQPTEASTRKPHTTTTTTHDNA